ncbi:MAG: hypothetical protein ACREPR_11850 [Brasilonema sp.]
MIVESTECPSFALRTIKIDVMCLKEGSAGCLIAVNYQCMIVDTPTAVKLSQADV